MAEPISRAEWDFSECPTNESIQCFFWEYSRESELIKQDVRQLRKRKKTFDASFKSIGTDIFSAMQGRMMASFYFCPEFPEYPYLSVPSKERKRRREILCGEEGTGMAALIDARGWLPEYFDFRADRAFCAGEPLFQIGSNELVMLRVNWECTDNILKNQFVAWLKKNRPKDVKRLVQGHGLAETQAKYKLKDLGVWRLLNTMNYADAVALTEEELGKSLYKGQSEWTKSKDRASKVVRCFAKHEAARIQSSTSPNS